MGGYGERWAALQEVGLWSWPAALAPPVFLSAPSALICAAGMVVTPASQASCKSKATRDFRWCLCDCNSVHAHVGT